MRYNSRLSSTDVSNSVEERLIKTIKYDICKILVLNLHGRLKKMKFAIANRLSQHFPSKVRNWSCSIPNAIDKCLFNNNNLHL
jgi:hypothetical protein